MKSTAQFALSVLLVTLLVSNAAASEIAPWPPSDPNDSMAPSVSAAWVTHLRGIRTFGDLQKAIGARGKLVAVDETVEAPHAVYQWTGAAGQGQIRAFLYRSGDFGVVIDPADKAGEIQFNNFGAFVCAACSPPIKACGRRPSWVPHSVHWDTFDCDYTLTGPSKLRSDK